MKNKCWPTNDITVTCDKVNKSRDVPTVGQHAIVFFTRTRQFKFANKICPIFVSHIRPLYSQLCCKQLNFCYLKTQPIFLSSKILQHRINGTPKHITPDSCNYHSFFTTTSYFTDPLNKLVKRNRHQIHNIPTVP